MASKTLKPYGFLQTTNRAWRGVPVALTEDERFTRMNPEAQRLWFFLRVSPESGSGGLWSWKPYLFFNRFYPGQIDPETGIPLPEAWGRFTEALKELKRQGYIEIEVKDKVSYIRVVNSLNMESWFSANNEDHKRSVLKQLKSYRDLDITLNLLRESGLPVPKGWGPNGVLRKEKQGKKPGQVSPAVRDPGDEQTEEQAWNAERISGGKTETACQNPERNPDGMTYKEYEQAEDEAIEEALSPQAKQGNEGQPVPQAPPQPVPPACPPGSPPGYPPTLETRDLKLDTRDRRLETTVTVAAGAAGFKNLPEGAGEESQSPGEDFSWWDSDKNYTSEDGEDFQEEEMDSAPWDDFQKYPAPAPNLPVIDEDSEEIFDVSEIIARRRREALELEREREAQLQAELDWEASKPSWPSRKLQRALEREEASSDYQGMASPAQGSEPCLK